MSVCVCVCVGGGGGGPPPASPHPNTPPPPPPPPPPPTVTPTHTSTGFPRTPTHPLALLSLHWWELSLPSQIHTLTNPYSGHGTSYTSALAEASATKGARSTSQWPHKLSYYFTNCIVSYHYEMVDMETYGSCVPR